MARDKRMYYSVGADEPRPVGVAVHLDMLLSDEILGFTGTREIPTGEQAARMVEFIPIAAEIHHGCCVGADEAAHAIAMNNQVAIVKHPPTDKSQMARTCTGGEERTPLPYLERNKRIVFESSLLLAVPKSVVEEQRGSGTWATIRYARGLYLPHIIIYPDGSYDLVVYQ